MGRDIDNIENEGVVKGTYFQTKYALHSSFMATVRRQEPLGSEFIIKKQDESGKKVWFIDTSKVCKIRLENSNTVNYAHELYEQLMDEYENEYSVARQLHAVDSGSSHMVWNEFLRITLFSRYRETKLLFPVGGMTKRFIVAAERILNDR